MRGDFRESGLSETRLRPGPMRPGPPGVGESVGRYYAFLCEYNRDTNHAGQGRADRGRGASGEYYALIRTITMPVKEGGPAERKGISSTGPLRLYDATNPHKGQGEGRPRERTEADPLHIVGVLPAPR